MRLWARVFIVGSAASPPNPAPAAAFSDPTRLNADPFSDPGGLDPVDGVPDRWVVVNADLCMGDTAIRRALIHKLRKSLPGLYGERNVAFVGTHTHAAVSGFHNVLLPTVTNLGISRQNIDAIVEGAYRAIVRAHQDFEQRRGRVVDLAGETTPRARGELAQLQLAFGNATLRQAHINRSPIAYQANPAWEKDAWGSDQDDEFALLRFRDVTGEVPGFLSWYAVHGTSLKPNNTLTSSDNKGLAAFLVEQRMAERKALAKGFTPAQSAAQALELAPGTSPFVAGFSQASVGDTSPNTLGAYCEGSNQPCDHRTSTCPVRFLGIGTRNTSTTCHSRGPGHGDEEARQRSPTGGYDWRSNELIAAMQAETAESILHRPDSVNGIEAWMPVRGRTHSVKWTVDMSNYTFALPNGTRVSTNPASLGFAFAGGTTDGPGQFDFHQGHLHSEWANPFWKFLRPFVHEPSRRQKRDQEPKHILFDTGTLTWPYAWSPSSVETQIFQVGNFFILVVPGEFTTMAGRRLKAAVRQALKQQPTILHSDEEPIVVLCGPANTYGHYVTTWEEYGVQRYEGGATVFGPWTLAAYVDIYTRVLVPALAPGAPDPSPGWSVPININRAYSLTPGVVLDRSGRSHQFGDVLRQPEETYTVPSAPGPGLPPVGMHDAQANVSVVFVGADPRNDLRLGQSHFVVQKWEAGEGMDRELNEPNTPLRKDFGSSPGVREGLRGWWRTVRTDAHHTTLFRWIPNLFRGTSRVEVSWAIEPHTPTGVYRIAYFGAAKAWSGHVSPFVGISRDFALIAATP